MRTLAGLTRPGIFLPALPLLAMLMLFATASFTEPQQQVFLHYDYMVLADQGTYCNATSDCNAGQSCTGNVCRGHTHKPQARGIQAVVEAFAAHGIMLHIDPNHTAIPEIKVITVGFQPYPACSGPDAISIGDLRNTYLRSQHPGEHYSVFGHLATCPNTASCGKCPHDPSTGATPDPTSTGMAELPGENFVVAGANTLSRQNESATFMHELGHNFGLQHGGAESVNYKPNYVSVMNYSYESLGIAFAEIPGSIVPKRCSHDSECGRSGLCDVENNVCVRIDYSEQRVPPLNELNLDENVGVSAAAGDTDLVFYFVPGAPTLELIGPSNGPIDWNNDGNASETPVQADLNNDGAFTLLTGFNDWDYLLRRLSNGGASAAVTLSRGAARNEPSLTSAFQRFPYRVSSVQPFVKRKRSWSEVSY